MAKKEFNPFYDSNFLISREGSDERRMLVELHQDELVQLRDEIDAVLKNFGKVKNENSPPTKRVHVLDLLNTSIDSPIEVYSITNSNDLLVLQLDSGSRDYYARRLSYDLIEENLDNLNEYAMLVAGIDSSFVYSNDSSGKIFLSDVIKRTGIVIDSYVCGFDSSDILEAVSCGFAYVQARESSKETMRKLLEESSVDELLYNATMACEEMNKGVVDKNDIEIEMG